jgi:hypothetical protein
METWKASDRSVIKARRERRGKKASPIAGRDREAKHARLTEKPKPGAPNEPIAVSISWPAAIGRAPRQICQPGAIAAL